MTRAAPGGHVDETPSGEADPILITGVGRRLGLHLTRTFLDRGQPVIGTYRRERDELDTLRQRGARLHRCDLDDPDAIDALVHAVSSATPRLRALIHNASDWAPDAGAQSAAAVMRRMMQIHVAAPYQLNLALAPLLEASRAPHADIIHIGDYVSGRGSRKHIALLPAPELRAGQGRRRGDA